MSIRVERYSCMYVWQGAMRWVAVTQDHSLQVTLSPLLQQPHIPRVPSICGRTPPPHWAMREYYIEGGLVVYT